MKTIMVKASKTYPVFIDSNLICHAGTFIKDNVTPKPAKVLLFSDYFRSHRIKMLFKIIQFRGNFD